MAKRAATAERTNGKPLSDAQAERLDALVGNAVRVIGNAMLARADMIRRRLDPRRDVDRECGHPAVVLPEDFQFLFERNAFAGKVVRFWPNECWRLHPAVYDDEDVEVESPFELAFKELAQRLQGQRSHHRDDDCAALWDVCRRADIQSRINRYGVILVGVDDGGDLADPVELDLEGREKAWRQLLYLRCLPELQAKVTALNEDRNDQRFGQPERYDLTLLDPAEGLSTAGAQTECHWTRIVHIVDGPLGNEVFAPEAMLGCLDNLLDLKKVLGGSAEGHWSGSFPGLAIEGAPGVEDLEGGIDALKSQLENYQGGYKRWLVLLQMTAKSLTPNVLDPRPFVEPQLDAVAIHVDVAKRIFLGSERGELASSQDEVDKRGKAHARRTGHCTARIVVPLVDRFIHLGVLPRPQEPGYKVWWPEEDALTMTDRADVAAKRTKAMAEYVRGDVHEVLMAPLDFLVRELGMTEDEAMEVLGNVLEAMKERRDEMDELGLADDPGAGGDGEEAGGSEGKGGEGAVDDEEDLDEAGATAAAGK